MTLPVGFQGSIVVFGYGNGISSGELDGNSYAAATGVPPYPWTTNDGGGLLSFLGLGRYSGGGGISISFPTNIDAGPANRYAAGTFAYAAVPEPSSIVMAVFGVISLISASFWRRPSQRLSQQSSH